MKTGKIEKIRLHYKKIDENTIEIPLDHLEAVFRKVLFREKLIKEIIDVAANTVE